MAGSNRRFALAIALPLLLLALPRLTGAATITVDTTSAGHVAGECTLEDAVKSANNQAAPSGSSCTAGSSNNDTIEFSVTGTIGITATLNITDAQLAINGFAGSPGITISGGNTNEIVMVGATNLTLENLTLAEGFVGGPPTAYGGAIFESMTNLEIENCTFIDNTAGGASAAGAGGAIFMNSGTVTIINSTFANNTAQSGAPLIMGVPSAGDGGAIFNDTGTLTTTNTTFSGNDAGVGAVISILSVFMHPAITSMRSTLLANTKGGGGNCDTSFGTVTDDGYNISDDDTCGFTMAPTGTSINNSTTLNLDPAGLQNNGGPTQTIAIGADSQAFHFIPVADCTDQSMPPMQVTTDQRGFPRPDPGNPNFCDAGAYELQTTPFVLAPNSERLQIARSTTSYDADQVNMAFTFTENGYPTCDAADDAFNGFTVLLRTGSCGALVDDASLELMLEPWVVQTVNHQSYGTIFQSTPPETVSARMVELPTPASPACGEWTVNIEVAGIDSSGLGNGPFALILSNSDGDTGCFDITNAIVGNQIDPPTRTVRRGVRR
ncbi:MAG: choice-of-anchor Q domain-containing protein [Candidatus Binatus sp.]|uniref:choice-of-anchor Q domain-containing protein n=1 Tax=Candidatus Binatus sp. TaxID=2811406 RepID=UPI003C760CF2